MQIRDHFTAKPLGMAAPLLAVLLLLLLACGSAAQPADEPANQPAAGVGALPTATPASVSEPASPQTGEGVHPGKLTWMVGGWGSGNFDYTYDVGGSNNSLRFFSAFLIETNEKTELIPGLASEWGLSEDGKTWTVTVRDGVEFHDGTPFTAADVLWTWQHQWDPGAVEWATQSGAQSRARIMEKIEQTGPNQVSLTTKVVDAAFHIGAFSAAASGPWPILPKRDRLHDEAAVEAFAKNPMGAGPMSFVRSVPSEVIEFRRYADYYYQPANGFPEDYRVKFTSLDLRLVPEEATRVAAIRAGEADIAPASLDTREQVESGGGRIVFGQEGIYLRVMLMGCWDPAIPCFNQKVRQAMAYAIDKNAMRDQLFGGPEVFQVKGWAKVTPSTVGYSPDLDPFPFDPEKGRQLMSEAGFPNGEGFGKLIVNTWVSTAMPFLPESAQLAADYWRNELGIDTEVRVGDESDLKKATLARTLNGQVLWRDNETGVDGSSTARSSYGTPDHTTRLHERPELFEAVQKALSVTDPDEQKVALNTLYRQLREEEYELGIGYVNIPWAVGARVLTWQPFPLAFYPSAYHTITLAP